MGSNAPGPCRYLVPLCPTRAVWRISLSFVAVSEGFKQRQRAEHNSLGSQRPEEARLPVLWALG